MVLWSYQPWPQQPSLVQQQISMLRQNEPITWGSRGRQQDNFIETWLVKSKHYLKPVP